MLPIEVMRQVRRLQLRARRAVQTLFGGEYRSTFKGTGLSFEDVREYQPGDDVRAIDWNVTARMGQPFIKRYAEERELTVMLVLDISGSMNFGTSRQTKRNVAAELAAVLAFAAITHGDRIGLLTFSDDVELNLPPEKSIRHAMRILREVLFQEPQGRGSNLVAALEQLNRVQRRRAIVFLFSDFLSDGIDEILKQTAQHHDLIAIRVTEPLERAWPTVGLVSLEDAETGEMQLIDTNSKQFQRDFADTVQDHEERFARLTRGSQTDVVEVSTDGKHFDALLNFFRQRERRQRR